MGNLSRFRVLACCLALVLLVSAGCSPFRNGQTVRKSQRQLGAMCIGYGANATFESEYFTGFAQRQNVRLDLMPPSETVKSRITLYEQIFRQRSPHPDIFEIDVIWASALAPNLVDLTPYLRQEIRDLDPAVLRNFTVNGRLVAVPTFLDIGVLYYRPDLLSKYGYQAPPATWDQLEEMSRTIQRGERRTRPEFWGYAWQGGAYEALTCNAMEWMASTGLPPFIDAAGKVHVTSPENKQVLRRALSWIGNISPPGEAYYREMDGINRWNEGDLAFMRGWVSSYRIAKAIPGSDVHAFRAAPLPGGPGGQRGSLGGLGMGVSRFSPDRSLAIEALRGFISIAAERRHTEMAGTIPTRLSLRADRELMSKTALPGELATRALAGLIARPALVTAEDYPKASEAYSGAINSVLTRHANIDEAMLRLDHSLHAVPRLRNR